MYCKALVNQKGQNLQRCNTFSICINRFKTFIFVSSGWFVSYMVITGSEIVLYSWLCCKVCLCRYNHISLENTFPKINKPEGHLGRSLLHQSQSFPFAFVHSFYIQCPFHPVRSYWAPNLLAHVTSSWSISWLVSAASLFLHSQIWFPSSLNPWKVWLYFFYGAYF